VAVERQFVIRPTGLRRRG